MKTTVLSAAFAATLLFTSCFHENHELSALESGMGLVGAALRWEMPEDVGTAVHALSLAPGSTGTPYSRNYKSVAEASGELLAVPTGSCDLLAIVNMTEADGFILSGMPASRADIMLGDILVSLTDPVSSPDQAWFGIASADIASKTITILEPILQRLLSTLTINISNVPAGTKVVFTLSNVAKNVNITARDAGGRFGLPSAESVGDLELARLTAASDGPLAVEDFNLLPTASAFTRCILTIDIITDAGIPLTCVCDAPHIESGKGYRLDLDFNHLRPYMYLDTYTINEWEDGWAVSGEVLNPKE